MRFEVSNLANSAAAAVEIPWRDAQGESYADLRENASAITGIAAARENLPMAAFLTALNGDASIFSTVRAKTWIDSNASSAGGNTESIFHSRVDLIFSDSKLNTQEHQEDAVRRLIELWMKEPASDSFSARLEIRPCRLQGNSNAAALRIILSGRGSTPDHARMRWGLGSHQGSAVAAVRFPRVEAEARHRGWPAGLGNNLLRVFGFYVFEKHSLKLAGLKTG